MNIFVAGATGAIGARLVAALVERGHEVTGTTRSPQKAEKLFEQGARPALLADPLDREAMLEAVTKAQPEVVVPTTKTESQPSSCR